MISVTQLHNQCNQYLSASVFASETAQPIRLGCVRGTALRLRPVGRSVLVPRNGIAEHRFPMISDGFR